MKQIYKSLFSLISLMIAALLLSSCSGLPDNMVHEAKLLPYKIKQQGIFINERKTAFEHLNTHKEWSFIQPYLEKEQWSAFFVTASNELANANALYESKIKPMLDRDDPKDRDDFSRLLYQFDKLYKASTEAAFKAEQRMAFMITIRDTAPAIYDQARREWAQVKALESQLITQANKAMKDYGPKTDDIKQRVKAISEMASTAQNAMNRITEQFKKFPTMDYALFGDESVNLSQTLKQTQQYHKVASSKLNELYRSYVKVLADQRIEYYVVIGRANWCEGEFCGNGSTRHYPPAQVDEKMFEYFDALTVNTIATNRPGFFSDDKFKLYIPEARWNALKIQKKWSWPRGDDYADYWVEKTYADTFHKYIEIVNDKMTEGGWVKVDENSFWQQYDNLGMAILSKPYGSYEEDAIKEAQPVGMATIATPTMKNGIPVGSNQYGEWRHSNGQSFWYYYGMYHVIGSLIGPRAYYYNDWRGYSSRARGKPYYGRDEQYGTWGSSTYSHSRYRNSDYARRNPDSAKTSRSSRASSSIRGAGASNRSRGPAGGGK